MSSFGAGIWGILLYALILIAGAVTGYRKAKSKASLWTGLVCSGLLILAFVYAVIGQTALGTEVALLTAGVPFLSENSAVALLLATFISVFLVALFGIRWFRTRKMVPAGLFFLINSVALAFFLISLQGALSPE
ncbi:MAG: TMEM14 family protein [Armatimonadetes bacterium]|nr:TMEM14 family protein [Armatimonadota bacterium]MDW8120719.1 TMEM14 family protein [Armatimonadota bacterium]